MAAKQRQRGNGRAAGMSTPGRGALGCLAPVLLIGDGGAPDVKPGPAVTATLATSGTTITRKPASRARELRSRARRPPLGSAGSNPPSEVQVLRQNSMPPAATQNTGAHIVLGLLASF
jgi:hypothetical protein